MADMADDQQEFKKLKTAVKRSNTASINSDRFRIFKIDETLTDTNNITPEILDQLVKSAQELENFGRSGLNPKYGKKHIKKNVVVGPLRGGGGAIRPF